MGYETDTGKLKIGDGATAWATLSYFAGVAPAAYGDADVDTHLNQGTATSGQLLSWSGSDYDWIDAAAGGGASTIAGLPDVDMTGAVIGDVLEWTGSQFIAVDHSYFTTQKVDLHLNTASATGGQVMGWTGSDYDWIDPPGSPEVVLDTTPQLGGTLDANTHSIDMGVNTITDAKVGNWDTAFGWGDHSGAGYLTTVSWAGVTGKPATFTPSAHTHLIADITDFTDNSTNWNTAHGWGNHGVAGYLTAGSVAVITGAWNFNSSPLLANNTPLLIKKSGGTGINAVTIDGSDVMTVGSSSAGTMRLAGPSSGISFHVNGSEAAHLNSTTLTVNSVKEGDYSLTGLAIAATNGSFQRKAISGATTFTETLADGESVTLILDWTSGVVTWPAGILWEGGTAPTLAAGDNIIQMFHAGGTLYGAYSGVFS